MTHVFKLMSAIKINFFFLVVRSPNLMRDSSKTDKKHRDLTFPLPYFINPLSPHDALKHHFTSLKTDLIFLQPRVLERKFP